MDYKQIAIIIVASLIGFAYLLKIRSLDIYEKEPLFKLFLVMVLGGFLSVMISMVFYSFIEPKYTFVDAIVKIGLVEEASKLLALMVLYFYIRKDFNEIVDGVIYITAISLGFSIIENIMYSFGSTQAFSLLFQRSIYSVLGHISFSGYMGLAFYIHKKVHKNYLGILLALALAAVAHGLYDGVLFVGKLNPYFKLVFIILVILQYRFFIILLSFSRFRHYLRKELFTAKSQEAYLYCCKCLKKIHVEKHEFKNINVGFCDSCGNMVVNRENIPRLFAYFRPTKKYKSFVKKLDKSESTIKVDDEKKVIFSSKGIYLSAETSALAAWLDSTNNNDKLKIMENPVLGLLIRGLGLRYLVKS
jgi:RsiW-degrading membrane proteinase PrsW (M82 family)